MDTEPTSTTTFDVGLLLEQREAAPPEASSTHPPDENFYTDAAGRHRLPAGSRFAVSAQLVSQIGEAAVRTAARAVATQVALVADEITAELERRAAQVGDGRALDVEEAKITFGLKLTAGSGAGLSALFTAKAESNVEVAITVRRQKP
jgi:hypothetical protein